MSPEQQYAQLGELIATMPAFGVRLAPLKMGPADFLWFGRAHALLEQRLASIDAMQFQLAWTNLGSSLHDRSVSQIQSLLYGALARVELLQPVSARGAFIGAGDQFDALASIGRVLREAAGSLLIVDPYLNETFLTDFAAMVPEGIPIRLLSGRKGVDGTLEAAARRWVAQYGSVRPLQVRLASKGALHDRIILDDVHAWALSQSFKDFASRSPASIIRSDAELTAMKRDAFEGLWASAEPI
jgi:hypothetical protein